MDMIAIPSDTGDVVCVAEGKSIHFLSPDGKVLRVFDADGVLIPPLDEFPTKGGAPSFCTEQTPPNGMPPVRLIKFYNGGIEIYCDGIIDVRGDMNLNNIPCEPEDLELFRNYFLWGLSVFTVIVEAQIAASDVNRDGITIGVADYVKLERIIA